MKGAGKRESDHKYYKNFFEKYCLFGNSEEELRLKVSDGIDLIRRKYIINPDGTSKAVGTKAGATNYKKRLQQLKKSEISRKVDKPINAPDPKNAHRLEFQAPVIDPKLKIARKLNMSPKKFKLLQTNPENSLSSIKEVPGRRRGASHDSRIKVDKNWIKSRPKNKVLENLSDIICNKSRVRVDYNQFFNKERHRATSLNNSSAMKSSRTDYRRLKKNHSRARPGYRTPRKKLNQSYSGYNPVSNSVLEDSLTAEMRHN
jgi:hypothetical protein